MLSSELLATRISRGKVSPVYARFDSEDLEIAGMVIASFREHVGKSYGELLEELEGFEEMNFRFIRGLSQLLLRRAMLESASAVDSSFARETVFEACGGLAATPSKKQKALEEAAQKLSISVSELEKALWADLEENQVLKEFQPLSAEELLRNYNVSLTQTLLFKAVDLDIWIEGNYQEVLWRIVRLGLMYSLEETENGTGVHLHLDGPASLFRMSEKYGNAFARIFSVLLKCKSWRLRAGILHKGFQGKRILEFTLEDKDKAFASEVPKVFEVPKLSGAQLISESRENYGTGNESSTDKIGRENLNGRDNGKDGNSIDNGEDGGWGVRAENISYDSAIEQAFGGLSFGNWRIRREPAVLKAGRYAFIPDFSLERDGMLVYVEIMGFWTSEYLEKKIRKLKEVREPVVLLINRRLKCSEKDFPAKNVIFYDKRVPAPEVMQLLRAYEEQKLEIDRKSLQDAKIPLSGELISLEALSKERGIWTEALKDLLSERLAGSKEYVLLENYVLHKQFLEKLDLELKKPGQPGTYAGAVKVFQEHGLDQSLFYAVLEYLGYKVVWCGLSQDDAKIQKAKPEGK